MVTNQPQWLKLSKESLKDVPKKQGVYTIRYPMKIPRLLGVDEDGILVIGETHGRGLKERLVEFLDSINGQNKHPAGFTFYLLNLEIIFYKENLEFMFVVKESGDEARSEEASLLEKYEDKFGELPPLNKNSGSYPEGYTEYMIRLVVNQNTKDEIKVILSRTTVSDSEVLKLSINDIIKNIKKIKDSGNQKYLVNIIKSKRIRDGKDLLWEDKPEHDIDIFTTDNLEELTSVLNLSTNDISQKIEEVIKGREKNKNWLEYANKFL